ncbi:MAG: hydrogenase maturation nickel metallochaperone HypA [Anaerolineales bacterium]|nr:hydrogenase maturation nickel metallochaperone HypA [Anaerolineales bacterium]
MQKNPRLSSMIDHLLRQSKRYKSAHLVAGTLISFDDQQIHAQWNESPLAQTTLTIRRVPAQQQCMVCFEKYQPARVEVSCPQCGSVGAKIIAGEEFYFESIEEENA